MVSERRRDLVESVLLTGDDLTTRAVAEAVDRLADRGRDGARGAHGAPSVRATYELRYAGQAFELPIDGEPRPDPAELRRAFDRAHEERYGYADPDAELELVTIRVAVALPGAEPRPAEWDGASGASADRAAREVRRRCPARRSSSAEGWRARAEADLVVMEQVSVA